jgi:hypothetical protein
MAEIGLSMATAAGDLVVAGLMAEMGFSIAREAGDLVSMALSTTTLVGDLVAAGLMAEMGLSIGTVAGDLVSMVPLILRENSMVRGDLGPLARTGPTTTREGLTARG